MCSCTEAERIVQEARDNRGGREGLTDPLALIVCDLVTGDQLCRREEGPFTRQSLLDLSPAQKRGRVRMCRCARVFPQNPDLPVMMIGTGAVIRLSARRYFAD